MERPGLPSPNTRRWVARKKAMVARAYVNGWKTLDELLETYRNLSREELLSWVSMFEAHGQGSLRATRIQDYRETRCKNQQ